MEPFLCSFSASCFFRVIEMSIAMEEYYRKENGLALLSSVETLRDLP
jgi:hypothetical protein